ncbi:MAG: type I methionyl aminopeptidase [Erysipelotrichales bacterium]|nr:type I methionyl aminopeptidase [Erysipelotrichales bacterium]
MINIYSDEEIEIIKESGHITYMCHQYLKELLSPGVTTKYIDDEAGKFICEHGGIPSCLGYEGYPGNICISINDEVVHGIGSDDVILKEGDIVTLDICTLYKGYHSDSAWSYAIGKINKEKEHLMYHTEKALYVGLKELKAGVPLGNASARIEQYAKKHGLGVVRELVGHGVGHELHEAPDVPNYGKYNTGVMLKPGMVIAVEPMLTAGKRDVAMLDDDWTIVTQDGSPAAHFEHTVAIREDGYEILTGE